MGPSGSPEGLVLSFFAEVPLDSARGQSKTTGQTGFPVSGELVQLEDGNGRLHSTPLCVAWEGPTVIFEK